MLAVILLRHGDAVAIHLAFFAMRRSVLFRVLFRVLFPELGTPGVFTT